MAHRWSSLTGSSASTASGCPQRSANIHIGSAGYGLRRPLMFASHSDVDQAGIGPGAKTSLSRDAAYGAC